MLTAKEIRRKYLAFFARHGHRIVPSGPIIPSNDPTLLFTNAGMVPFKKYFTGEETPPCTRLTSSQKCLRVSGKHNDLENVGRTARHHTFFEMLGNFSFGDYFKREAIRMAWEFVTVELGLPKDRLWITVYKDDEEAETIWREEIGVPAERIIRLGEKDNFWTMGDTGPCGPCSEIHYDQGEDMACGPDCGVGRCDCDRFLEIWNLVFTQFDQQPDGSRLPLARPNIDTGMGLERIAAVCQGKRSNFDCDLFQDIIGYAAELAHVRYSFSAPDTNDVDTALRVIADHARSACFLIAAGVLPSNEGRGYVLRRLVRRALRFATLMGVHEPFLYQVCRKVTELMGDDYPELTEQAEFIARAVREEEQRFSQTLGKGLELLEAELAELAARGETRITGEFCFKLSDTYGFPLDIVTDVSEKRGFQVDAAGFEACMAEQRRRARDNQKKAGLLGAQGGGDLPAALTQGQWNSIYVGDAMLTAQGHILALVDEQGESVSRLPEGGKGYLVCSQTPFYAESGGQCGDTGLISAAGGAQARVLDTLKFHGLPVHLVEVFSGSLAVDDEICLSVDADRRRAVTRNHSATHLLHAALRKVLGAHVKQAGSLVTPQRLRFDFSHLAALTADELAAVEHEVNAAIMADLPVHAREMSRDEAERAGAMALFGEKYGDTVRVVNMGDGEELYSLELCGGSHVERTGAIGPFAVLSESGVAAGTRRIEAVTGWGTLELLREQRESLQGLAARLKTRPDQIGERVQALQDEVKKLRKAVEKAAAPASGDIMQGVEEIGGIKVLAARLENVPVKALRDLMDGVRSRLPSGVACLATVEGDKVGLLLYVSKDLHGRFTAPALIKTVAAPCGGSGGGRPDLAQAGGNNVDGIEAAFAALKQEIDGHPAQ
ncbi:alanine--tRNA ligase [uncultured Desulfovibrio sp.]|uniref:alanine--tRNA ligase n=1 Tax=uncultured Desulfovibrio sp. TaxID=167968 RepID=UPI002608E093|nr:alanine--tRNA ligase [uncultured Desulfovibrio sp.]